MNWQPAAVIALIMTVKFIGKVILATVVAIFATLVWIHRKKL